MKKSMLLILCLSLTVLFLTVILPATTVAVETLPEGSTVWVDKNANGTYDGGVDTACDSYVDALAAISADGQTVYMTENCDFSAPIADTRVPYSYTLDLGGCTLRGSGYILTAYAGKTVTLKNGDIYGSYKNTGSSHALHLQSGATLILDHVKLYNGGTFDGTAYPGRTAIATGTSTDPTGSANIILKNDSFVYTAGGGSPAYAIGALYGSMYVTLENSHVKSDDSKYAIYGASASVITMDSASSVSCAVADMFLSAKCSLSGSAGYEAIKVYDMQDQCYRLTMEPVTHEGIAVTVSANSGGNAYLDSGESSVTVQKGAAVALTVAPDEGWYVDAVYAGQTALDVAQTGGTVTWTPTQSIEPVTVSFAQYAAKYESTDKSVVQYTTTMTAALGMVNADTDTITLCRDVVMDEADYLGNTYRIEMNRGFTLDLGGHVLSSDRSILRLMSADGENEATVTFRNGMLVAAAESSAQHMISLCNKGNLVLENVQAYCGAYYTDGQVVINDSEVAATSSGVSAVIMCSGEGNVTVKDSTLQTYGNYWVINTYNTNQDLGQSRFCLENAKLITDSTKPVFGCSDKRAYTVTLLDANTELLTRLSTNGAGADDVEFAPCSGYGLASTGSVELDGKTYYRYALVPLCTVTWVNYDGTVLETRDDVPLGTVPTYTGQPPVRPADQTQVYAFSGWTPEVTAITGHTVYMATYISLPPDYQPVSLDLVTQTRLYKTQGRTYLSQDGLNLDYAGSSVEFIADCGGALYMTYTAQTDVYYQVFIDGEACDRVYAAPGENLTVRLDAGPAAGEHTIRIVRDSDIVTQGQTTVIKNITFTGRVSTLKAPASRELYIEFIGDSITAGKYTAMEYGSGTAIHKATNSYALLTAQAMDADYSVVARGGCGYFRVSSCPKPIHLLYPYYNGFRTEPVAYTPDRRADVVVLALGTNDTAAAVKESYENGTVPFATFQTGVEYMIDQIRQMHGEDVKIVLLHNMMTGSWENELRSAALAKDVYFLKVTQDRNGGSNHPSAQGHQVIARELTEFLNETVLANASVCDGNKTVGYRTLQDAIDAVQAGQYIRLNADVSENVTVSGDVYLNLNGKTLTGSVAGEGTLYGMDSTTDGYSDDRLGRITGPVSCNVAGNFKTNVTGSIKRYMAIRDEQGITFHRFYLGVTHMNLNADTVSVGYKATFAGDDMVKAQINTYGFNLWVEGGQPVTSFKSGYEFVSLKTVVLQLRNFDVENHGETPVSATVFIKLNDGTTIESGEYSYSLRNLLETVNDDLSSYTEQQLSALKTLCQLYRNAMTDWDIDNILN